MIWRLTYCNKNGVEARVDIIKGDRTSVEVVQGSADPFTLSYKLDKNDKSGHIMASSADIEFFETEEFNIDKLKTSNETELKVEYFEGNILTWAGFILPDFFSREIGSPNIVRMTASDRLSALKGVTLSDLPIRVSLRDLIELSLEQTGLDLALVAQIQINQGSTNILDSEILSQRLTDTRGRSISCYDILMSIMVATHSTIRQRGGQWVVYNKLEHELRTPTIFFDKVERGAIRTIQPVASSVGIYKEFGGSKTYPENYNFKSGGVGWTVNFPEEMSASFSSNNILGFDVLTSGGGYQPVYGDETNNPHVVIYGFRGPLNYLKSEDIPVPSGYTNEVDIKLDVNASAPIWNFGSHQRVSVFAVKGERTQVLTSNGFVDISTSSESEYIHTLQFEAGVVLAGELARVDTNSLALSGKLSDSEGLNGYSVHVRLYSSDRAYATVINFASINFAPTGDSPKGDLYKTTQGSNFTKQHDVETTIFGDYITSGLNGYFYNYSIDDTSNLYLPNGELASPAWITVFDTTERPLLHHISRQKSRLFSVAHDILKANINVESFDPLAVFQDCKGGKYVVVSASFDFLRSEVDVELEQIAEDTEIFKRDFIYSYFGEGESNIKSIGGIAGSGGGTGGTGGGGMTSEQLEMLTNLASWWKLDEENDAIYSEKSVYSLKGISALGLGDGGGSGGGGADMLDSWANYTSEKADYYVPASLLVPFRNDTLSRLTSLEDIEIGGRNLIVLQNVVDKNGRLSAVTNDTKYIYNDTGFYTTDKIYVNEGDEIVLTSHRIISGYLALGYFDEDDIYFSRPVMVTDFEANSYVLTIPSGVAYIRVSFLGSDSNYIKLEKANKPSDWSPAPEDQVSDWSTTDVTSFSYIKNKPTTLAGYGITDAVTLNTAQTITGAKTFTAPTTIGNIIVGNDLGNQIDRLNGVLYLQRASANHLALVNGGGNVGIGTASPTEKLDVVGNIASTGGAGGRYSVLSSSGVRSYGAASGWVQGHNFFMNDETPLGFSSGAYASNISTFNYFFYGGDYTDPSVVMLPNKNVGIGTTNPLYKLDVSGDGRFTSSLITPKVDFGNGFTIEPSGTELVFKYNGVIKQRMLSTGTILATGGLTALTT